MAANFDLSALKRCLCGAAPLGRALTFEFQDRVGCCVYQGDLQVEGFMIVSSLFGVIFPVFSA